MTREGYDAALFRELARVAPESFWFRARNRLIVSSLERHFPEAGSFLEVGCGDGFVLAAVREAFPHLRLAGLELFEEGLRLARERLPQDVELVQGDARELPYGGDWDAIGCFDTLEHVEEDGVVLRGIHRALRPGGGLLLLVPQHPWLWSEADEFAHHVRRYTRRGLLDLLRASSFEIVATSSFVSTLLPAMVLSRLRSRVAPRTFDPVRELLPGRRLNRVLERVLDGERRLIERGLSLPAGGSLLVAARRAG